VGCGDPELRPLRGALEAYDAGRSALTAGDAARAAEHFAEARSAADHPALAAWEAAALSEAGRDSAALERLDRAVGLFPADVTLRYNRAAARARLGATAEAAADLGWLRARGALDPDETGADPDFAALAADPEHAHLARAPRVTVGGQAEDGAVILGEEWTVTLTVEAPTGAELWLERVDSPTGLLRLTRVVEDVLEAPSAWRERRTLTFTWKAVAPGTGRLGPVRVHAGSLEADTGSWPVEVLALGGRAPADARGGVALEGPLLVPSQHVGERTPPWLGELAGSPWAVLGPRQSLHGSTVDTTDGPTLVLRRSGQPRWTAQPAAAGAEIREAGEPAVRGTP